MIAFSSRFFFTFGRIGHVSTRGKAGSFFAHFAVGAFMAFIALIISVPCSTDTESPDAVSVEQGTAMMKVLAAM